MNLAVVAANVAGWPLLQLGLARAFVCMPDRFFRREWILLREGSGERPLYRNLLRIRRWKGLLPDGGQQLGSSFSKQRLLSLDPGYLQRFILETRRGELTHWAAMACCPLFYLWNPLWACMVITVYAAAANLPCILVQRYNRFTLARFIAR